MANFSLFMVRKRSSWPFSNSLQALERPKNGLSSASLQKAPLFEATILVALVPLLFDFIRWTNFLVGVLVQRNLSFFCLNSAKLRDLCAQTVFSYLSSEYAEFRRVSKEAGKNFGYSVLVSWVRSGFPLYSLSSLLSLWLIQLKLQRGRRDRREFNCEKIIAV